MSALKIIGLSILIGIAIASFFTLLFVGVAFGFFWLLDFVYSLTGNRTVTIIISIFCFLSILMSILAFCRIIEKK